jgi:hypothetical protein
MKHALPLLFCFLLVGCLDVPIRVPVDLEHHGVVIDQAIKFHFADRYSYGFAFWPAKGTNVTRSALESAFDQICPTVDVAILDESNAVVMRESSALVRGSQWNLTSGTQDREFDGEIYKFITFTPVPNRPYRLRVAVVQPCRGANAASPHFFIERPMSGP